MASYCGLMPIDGVGTDGFGTLLAEMRTFSKNSLPLPGNGGEILIKLTQSKIFFRKAHLLDTFDTLIRVIPNLCQWVQDIFGYYWGYRDKNLPGKLVGPYRAPRKLLKRMDMADSPAAARWYIAELTEEVTLEGDPQNFVHKKTRIIFADSPQDAYEKALAM